MDNVVTIDKLPSEWPKDYLGDGVYAAFDGYNIRLTFENGMEVLDCIYLDPAVLEALDRFRRRVRASLRRRAARGGEVMARYKDGGFGINFNDNDGGASFFVNEAGIQGYQRYAQLMGMWRARLFFLRKAWRAIRMVECCAYARERKQNPKDPYKPHKVWGIWKPLKGWKA